MGLLGSYRLRLGPILHSRNDFWTGRATRVYFFAVTRNAKTSFLTPVAPKWRRWCLRSGDSGHVMSLDVHGSDSDVPVLVSVDNNGQAVTDYDSTRPYTRAASARALMVAREEMGVAEDWCSRRLLVTARERIPVGAAPGEGKAAVDKHSGRPHNEMCPSRMIRVAIQPY